MIRMLATIRMLAPLGWAGMLSAGLATTALAADGLAHDADRTVTRSLRFQSLELADTRSNEWQGRPQRREWHERWDNRFDGWDSRNRGRWTPDDVLVGATSRPGPPAA